MIQLMPPEQNDQADQSRLDEDLRLTRRRVAAWTQYAIDDWGKGQAWFAKKAGVDPGNLNRLLKDGGPLGFDMFMQLCWATGNSPNKMTGEDPPKGDPPKVGRKI